MTAQEPAGPWVGTVVRSLWWSRALAGSLLGLTAGLAAAAHPLGLAWIPVAAGAEALALARTARLARALRDGREGEVLLRAGPRVPLEAYRDHGAAGRWEASLQALISVWAAAAATTGPTLAALALQVGLASLLALTWWITRTRVESDLLVEVSVAAHRLDAPGLERALGRLSASRSALAARAARGARHTLRLWRGDAAGALSELEAGWDGQLDADAATLVLARLGLRGDTGLARRWLAAHRATNRFERWQLASVAGALALAEGRWEEALAASTDPGARDVPAPFLRQLDLVAAASLRSLGRTEEGDRLLAALDPPLDREPWRAAAWPRLWELLGRAPPPNGSLLPASAAPAPAWDQPFAPPASEAHRPVRGRATAGRTGGVPLEGVSLAAPRQGRIVQVLRAGSLILAAPITLVAALFLAVMDPSARGLALATGAFGLMGLASGLLRALELMALAPAAPGVRGVCLGDGRVVPARWWGWFALRNQGELLPVAAWGVAALALSEGLTEGSWPVLVLVPALLVAFGVVAWRRSRLFAVVRAAHFLPPRAARELAERALAGARVGRNPSRGWLALVRLFDGDPAGAEEAAREELEFSPGAAFVLGWLRAGRGEVDLEALLAAPDPRTLGDRHRAAVTLALAALELRQEARVAARLADWEAVAAAIPNRYGDLLGLLCREVRRRLGEELPGPVAPDLAWVAEVWPSTRSAR